MSKDLHIVDAPYDRLDRSIVRPYVITGGRTRPRVDLPLEALVQTTPLGRAMPSATLVHVEQRLILDLCHQRPHAVAEISAHLRLPLGVAKVILADMAQQQVVTIHDSYAATGSHAIELMERIRSGLRKL